MSLKRVNKDDLEVFTIRTRPYRSFISSSTGVSGSVKVFSRFSKIEKEINQYNSFFSENQNSSLDQNNVIIDKNIEKKLQEVVSTFEISGSGQKYTDTLNSYMDDVNSLGESKNKQSKQDIIRITPTFTFTKDSNIKNIIRKTLNPYYRTYSPSYNWCYSNYFSLNFFRKNGAIATPVLMYPATDKDNGAYANGGFVLTSSFTFDFYINPKRTSTTYSPGTVFHLSGCYAVSLISGSSKDGNGCPDSFRIMLQLKDGTNILPTSISTGSLPSNVFLSDDNSLQLNSWHHIVIRWGTSTVNNGLGEIIIDGQSKGNFSIPSSSIAPLKPIDDPSALFVGNFYSGSNSGIDSISRFFNENNSKKEGIDKLEDDPATDPVIFSFQNGLNAEIHDLCIKNYYVTDYEIANPKTIVTNLLDGAIFYLPPFFIPISPYRDVVNGKGGVLETPFQTKAGTTSTPFNSTLSFGVGGHYMNLENFVYDFASSKWPRLYDLITQTIDDTVNEAISCNDLLYASHNQPVPSQDKVKYGEITSFRNLLILPCDDGRFEPRFDLIKTLDQTIYEDKIFYDDLGVHDVATINLNNIVSEKLIKNQFDEEQSGIFEDIGVNIDHIKNEDTYYTVGGEDKPLYPILQRTKDNSSNQVVIFDVSNLFYGNKISPKSLRIADTSLRGSSGGVSINLVDDGQGNIYRNDSNTPGPTHSSVGNVYYSEGLIVIKDPSLFFLGYDNFEISFNGEQNIHTLKMNILVGANEFNSSSNPAYIDVPSSNKTNEFNKKFVYITGINYHDDNLNVVAKTVFAQPIIKRRGEKFLIKNRIDF